MNTAELISIFLRLNKVNSIDELSDEDIAYLYSATDLSLPYALSAYKERAEHSKNDAHELAELMRYCIMNNKELKITMDMQEGVFDTVEEQNELSSPYKYHCFL